MNNQEKENKFNTKDINQIISYEIKNKSLDLTIDYSELALDEILKDGILKEIPLVKSLVVFYNIYNSVVARYNVKKILTFFREFNSSIIQSDKLEKFKSKFSEDKNYQSKVIEVIVLLNERFIQTEKSKILAKLLISYIEEKISWDDFNDLCVVLDNIHPKGLCFLKKMAKENFYNHGRDQEGEALMFSCGIGHRHGSLFIINDFGKKLYEYGLKD